MPKSSVIEKILPLLTSLTSLISPPINFIKFLVIDKPSPVPPNLLVVEPSSCVKASKTLSCISRGIPTPVSLTSMVTFNFFASAVGSAIGPWLAGWLYDLTGNYLLAFAIAAACGAIAGVAVWVARRLRIQALRGEVLNA